MENLSRFKANVVYSIGIRCNTEIILKRLGLIKFSSLFGSMNIKTSNIATLCIRNPNILFDEKSLIYTKNVESLNYLNIKHGNRTLHRIFDDINDYHSSTIPHHDLSIPEHKEHFERGILRLNKIKTNNIPIVFIQLSNELEYNNSEPHHKLFNSFKEVGFNNYFLIQIFTSRNIQEKEIKVNDNYIIFHIQIDTNYHDTKNTSYDKKISEILHERFDLNDLISKETIDNM